FVASFFQAEDGIRDRNVTGVPDVCSSDLGKESGMVERDHHGHHHPNGHTAHDQPQSAKATATHTDHHASHETAMGHGGHEHHEHASGGHGQEGQHHAGHEAHCGHAGHGHGDHGDHVGQFRRLFWIMLVLGIPVVAFNPMFADLLGYQLPDATWV